MYTSKPPVKGVPFVSREGNSITFVGASNKVQFGSMLKEARIRQKLSQESLARLIGVSRFSITNWELNKNKPDHELMPKLCSILNLSLNDLYGITSEFSSFERGIIRNLRLLKPSTQRMVASFVSTLSDKELAEHDEMLLNSMRIIDKQPGALAAGTASSGVRLVDESPTPFFIRISDKTRKADAVVKVSGHSMEPKYHPDDIVYFEYSNTADIGDDVAVRWGGETFIKRLASDGTLYSLNPDYPFEYEGDGTDIEILGKVLGILNADDLPSDSDLISLKELFHDELVAYDRAHGGDY